MEKVDRLAGNSRTPIGPTAAVRVDRDAAKRERLPDPTGEVTARAIRAPMVTRSDLRA